MVTLADYDRPPLLYQGSFEWQGRKLAYWTRCERCPERKRCRHTCQHPGWMTFSMDGVQKVFWSGIITVKKIERAVREYVACDWEELPADVRPVERVKG